MKFSGEISMVDVKRIYMVMWSSGYLYSVYKGLR